MQRDREVSHCFQSSSHDHVKCHMSLTASILHPTAGPMMCYLETRYCLALLYAQLFQYRLREAQGLCDHLARQLQPHAGREEEEVPGGAGKVILIYYLSFFFF